MELHDRSKSLQRLHGDVAKGHIPFQINDKGDFLLGGSLKILAWKGPVGASDSSVLLEADNLIVTMARKVMSRLVAGAVSSPVIQTTGGDVAVVDPANLYIAQMRWGTAGHNPGNPTEALTPNAADENLGATITSPAFKAVTVDYPSYTSVRFTATLEQGEANGEGLSEEGLFSPQGFMFARKTFGILTKTSDFSFQFLHSILF